MIILYLLGFFAIPVCVTCGGDTSDGIVYHFSLLGEVHV